MTSEKRVPNSKREKVIRHGKFIHNGRRGAKGFRNRTKAQREATGELKPRFWNNYSLMDSFNKSNKRFQLRLKLEHVAPICIEKYPHSPISGGSCNF